MKRIALLVAVLIGLHSAAAVAADYALVIGVNECPNFRLPDGSRPRPLRGAESDATAMAGQLIDEFHFPKDRVFLLTGPQATRKGIRDAIAKLAELTKPHDRVVFDYSGHATRFQGHAALCCYDATELGKNLVRGDELGAWMEDVPANRVTVVLDCCHAGVGLKDAGDDIAARFLPLSPEAGRGSRMADLSRDLRGTSKGLGRRVTLFLACRPEQQAYERRLPRMKAPARVGQFTHYFLEGLAGKQADANRDGTVTAREAFDYALRRINEEFNAGRAPAEQQQPVLVGDGLDDPIFGIGR